MQVTSKAPVIFTPSAINEVKRLLSAETNLNKKLRIGVKGGGCSGMTYLLNFDEQKAEDELYELEGVSFIINKAHELYLIGMKIDWSDGLNSRGFNFINPNASTTCGCGTSFAV